MTWVLIIVWMLGGPDHISKPYTNEMSCMRAAAQVSRADQYGLIVLPVKAAYCEERTAK